MPNSHRPKKGSHGYSPRKRALSQTPRFSSWRTDADAPRLMGFAGYKVGMTHVLMVDFEKETTTAKQEIQTPVTVVEAPPLRIAGVRYYTSTPYGLTTLAEEWAATKDKHLAKRIPKHAAREVKDLDVAKVEEVRVIAYTQPHLVKGIPKKVPEIMEIPVGGKDMKSVVEYARGLLGKTYAVTDFAKDGAFVDVAAVTKGKGFQGHVKRWGVKLLHHKNSKHTRMIGNLGPKSQGGGKDSGHVLPTVPQAGQMGYHQRTELNKLILKIGDKGADIVPKGGFLHYGDVVNPYLVVKGSLPGPAKRLIRFRVPSRRTADDVASIEIKHVSLESKQGA